MRTVIHLMSARRVGASSPLPDQSFEDVCEQKQRGESMAQDLDQGREQHSLDMETLKNDGASLLSRTPLFVAEDHAMGIYVKETFDLLTHAEVIAKYKTTPRSIRLRAFKLRKYNLVRG